MEYRVGERGIMKIKGGLLACAVSFFGIYSASTQAAVVLGTYEFEDSQLVSTVNSFSGGDGFYDGVSLIDPVASPGTITDKDPTLAGVTFISTLPASSTPGADYNGVTIDLGFGTSQVNDAGSNDLALFFLFDQ